MARRRIWMSVVGARPQFVKAAMIERAVRSTASTRRTVDVVSLHTGQHYDHEMSGVFFRQLRLARPAGNLAVGSGSHGEQTAKMLVGIERAIERYHPDVMITYGDTNSSLAAALAAVKLGCPVAHVEAGLRSFNRDMPEEINRIVTDRLSRWCFCPTRTAVRCLAAEGIRERVYLVGDVMYDAFQVFRASLSGRAAARPVQGDFALATIHRAENTDDLRRLRVIVRALGRLGMRVVWPLHPRTKARLRAARVSLPKSVTALEPVSYLEMLRLEGAASVILTDSGGVQKEAAWSGTPCLTLRGETEWVETVTAGANVVVPPDVDAVLDAVKALRGRRRIRPMADRLGRGRAAERIVQTLHRELSGRSGRR